MTIVREGHYEGRHSHVEQQESPGLYLEAQSERDEEEEQTTPVLTVASSFTDSSSIQRGFVIPEESQDKK